MLQLEQPYSDRADNLPVALTSFVGRHEELRRLRLLAGRSRLVTLVGMGGIGKTRLALRLAQDLLPDFPDGVWFVDLTAVAERGQVADAAAAALRVPDPQASSSEALVAYLRQREALLVLDNCEHLIEAAAELAHRLMAACPRVRLIATSREPLRTSGETLFHVGPLASAGEALVLLEARARAYDPAFALTDARREEAQRLCTALEDIPLAIELAAARLRHLSLTELADGIGRRPQLLAGGVRDAGSRHQSLQLALDWSFDLLGANEQRALVRLSVFIGGFDLAAAEDVLTGLVSGQAVEVLGALVDRSLLERSDGARGRSRYRLLEPVRRYAEARLAAEGDADARTTHARHFRQLALEAWESVLEPEATVWSDRVEEEHGNFEAATTWLAAQESIAALEVVSRLWFYWFLRCRYAEGAARLEAALAAGGDQAPAHDRARAFCGLAWLGHAAAGALDSERASVDAERALEIARRIRDDELEAWSLIAAAAVGMTRDPGCARDRFEEATGVASGERLKQLRTYAFSYLATAEFMLGHRERAVSIALEALPAARSASPLVLVSTVMVLARDAVFQERPEAESLWEEALAASRAIGSDESCRFCLNWLAHLTARSGHLASAAGSWLEATRITRRVGTRQALVQSIDVAGLVLVAAGRHVPGLKLLAAAAALKKDRWLESPFWTARTAATAELVRSRMTSREAEAAVAEGAPLSVEVALEMASTEMTCLEASASARRRAPGGLSRRELEVARLIAGGLTNREVASRLFISERTAEGHVEHILNKLGLSNRTQVAGWIARSAPA